MLLYHCTPVMQVRDYIHDTIELLPRCMNDSTEQKGKMQEVVMDLLANPGASSVHSCSHTYYTVAHAHIIQRLMHICTQLLAHIIQRLMHISVHSCLHTVMHTLAAVMTHSVQANN